MEEEKENGCLGYHSKFLFKKQYKLFLKATVLPVNDEEEVTFQ